MQVGITSSWQRSRRRSRWRSWRRSWRRSCAQQLEALYINGCRNCRMNGQSTVDSWGTCLMQMHVCLNGWLAVYVCVGVYMCVCVYRCVCVWDSCTNMKRTLWLPAAAATTAIANVRVCACVCLKVCVCLCVYCCCVSVCVCVCVVRPLVVDDAPVQLKVCQDLRASLKQ